ncbi:MAG: hypothetical protein HYZ58_08130 [Acidobacteria bacterium]|nr:hypothetical protein [Acidobacteriota bacterium]
MLTRKNPPVSRLLVALAIVAQSFSSASLVFGFGHAQSVSPKPPDPQVESPVDVERPRSTDEERPRHVRRFGSRVRIGGDVHVASDELVRNPVVAVFGSVTVDGKVRDDVVAVFGDVRLGPSGEVTGDVSAVGGIVDQDPGSTVGGRINEVTFGVPRLRLRPPIFGPWFLRDAWLAPLKFAGELLRMMVLGFLACLLMLVAQGRVERIQREAAHAPWTAGLVGLVAELIFVPLLVTTAIVLVISIIGIPLLVLMPFLPLALFIAALIGFTATAYGLGRLVWERLGRTTPGPFAALVVGLAIVWALTFAGRITWFGGWPVRPIAAMVLFMGVLVEYVIWTIGLGATLITRFGTRPPFGVGAAAGPDPHGGLIDPDPAAV